MTVKLPDNIKAFETITADNVGKVRDWAKSLSPAIEVSFSNFRAAPPRSPGRGVSIEEARAKDPGPPCVRVSVKSKAKGVKYEQRVHLHKPVRFEVGLAARQELVVFRQEQEQALAKHVLSDAVLLSGVPNSVTDENEAAVYRLKSWDYPEATAKHFDLMGTLCPESTADPEYVKREARMHELRGIIKGDWRGELERVINGALFHATDEGGGKRNEQKRSVRTALNRARAGRSR